MLNRALAYFLKHGVANLSLRPLAAALRTSARMLVHHFGSKEELIAAVMERVREQLQTSFAALTRDLADAPPAEVMLAFWRSITSRAQLPYLRLMLEVQMLAIQNPARYRRYLVETSSSWLRLIEPALPAGPGRRARATLYAAVIDGLLLELLATDDSRRTSRALQLFISQLQGPAARSRTR